MFQFMDPFDLKENNLNVDAFLCKFSYLMTYYSWYEKDEIKSNLMKLDSIINQISKANGKKIF